MIHPILNNLGNFLAETPHVVGVVVLHVRGGSNFLGRHYLFRNTGDVSITILIRANDLVKLAVDVWVLCFSLYNLIRIYGLFLL